MSYTEPTKQYTVANGDNDGSTFKLPGDNPNSQAFFVGHTNEIQYHRAYIHVDNGWNQNIDVTVEGSHFKDGLTNNTLNSPVTDGSTVTISSSTTDFFTVTSGHSYLQLDVAPAADPTSGNLIVTFQRRKS